MQERRSWHTARMPDSSAPGALPATAGAATAAAALAAAKRAQLRVPPREGCIGLLHPDPAREDAEDDQRCGQKLNHGSHPNRQTP